MAATRAFPRRRLIVGHSLGQGYYYHFDGMEKVAEEDLAKVRGGMREIAARRPACPFPLALLRGSHRLLREAQPARHAPPPEEPQRPGHPAAFLRRLPRPLARPARAVHGRAFGLRPHGLPSGIPPALPARGRPVAPRPRSWKTPSSSRSTGNTRTGERSCAWARSGRLDELIREGGIQEFIQVAEALQDKKIAEIADRINALRDQVKVVLIAGPSSSGQDDVLQEAHDPAPRGGPQPRHDLP